MQTFFSFEFFPPKTDDGVESLWEKMESMVALQVRGRLSAAAGCTWDMRRDMRRPRTRRRHAPPADRASRPLAVRARRRRCGRWAPPRVRRLTASLERLRSDAESPPFLQPMFCDITWGAGGSTADLTLDIASNMQNTVRGRMPRARGGGPKSTHVPRSRPLSLPRSAWRP